MNIPNLLTLLRIILIPVLVLVIYLPFKGHHIVAAAVFILAAVTDWLDGYLARTLHQTSPFGAFLDPVADKLIVAVALVLLVEETKLPFLAIPAAVIVGREIVISALREWMAEVGKRASVAVSFIGKLKTAIQMLAVVVLLLYKPEDSSSFIIGGVGMALLWAAAVLTLWSMILYLRAAWSDLAFSLKSH